MDRQRFISFLRYIIATVLNSYAMLFFSNRKYFAALVLLVTFFNPYSGLAGLVATAVAVVSAYFIGFSREQVKTGLYTYSALLMGLGMGTFYAYSNAFWILLGLAAIFSVMLSAALIHSLGKNKLPALSLAFIISLWVVILASREFGSIGLSERNIYWLNEMYASGGTPLIRLMQWFDNLPLPDAVSGFFRSMSAILFQSNLAAGMLLTLSLLFFSRIALTLMTLGYTVAVLFIYIMDGYSGSVNYYNLGTNFMLVSVALGGFYIIPSLRSYLWSLITVPVSYILVIALWKITYTWGLPVFSLPFCLTVILFLYTLQLRRNGGKLVLTPIQYYSPEENLYRYNNNKERVLDNFYYQHLYLPFMGEWTVSQGYDGSITHKGDWGKALDFVITGRDGKTYDGSGTRLEDFYCYNKPVLAPAGGQVEEVIDYVEDNPIGGNNTRQNWGNTIILKHAEGLYTKLSHLRKGSVKVQKGQFVKKGDILAACGSSGRSPEPHLHFQVQSTPYVDSRTRAYPFAYYLQQEDDTSHFRSYTVPQEGQRVGNLVPSQQLEQAFRFQPGMMIKVRTEEGADEEWEAMVSMYNETYLYCAATQAAAYYVNNGTVFYFTHYFGKRKGLLYLFYMSAYKVVLSADKRISIADTYSQDVFGRHPLRWLQDFVAPFRIFMKMGFRSRVLQDDDGFGGGAVRLSSQAHRSIAGVTKEKMRSEVKVEQGRITEFTVETGHQKTTVYADIDHG